jgi:hypothetical protein
MTDFQGRDKGFFTAAFNGNNVSSYTTFYFNVLENTGGFLGTEAFCEVPVVRSMRLSNWRIRCDTWTMNGDSVFTIRKNNVDTGLTVTVDAADTVFTDLVNSVDFDAGDILTGKLDTSAASAGTLRYCNMGIQVD